MTELLQTDVLIIGCGIAGATAALQLAEAGLNVTVVTRATDPAETNTYYAQGGIIYRGVTTIRRSCWRKIFCTPEPAIAIRAPCRSSPKKGRRWSSKSCSIRSACRSIDPTAICRWRAKAATRWRASRTWPMPPAKRSRFR